MKNSNILVIGAPKSGTSALFFKIKRSVSKDYISFFEPTEDDIDKLDFTKGPYLIKEVSPHYKDWHKNFSKIIYIARDPRDRLISSIVYGAGFHKLPGSGFKDLVNGIRIFSKKQKDPQSISVKQIMQTVLGLEHGGAKSRIDLQLMEKAFIFHYEKLVLNDFAGLEGFLGFQLYEKNNVEKQFARVIRTKSSGSWRNWFLKEDVIYFKPIFKEYFEYFGYDFHDWNTNDTQIISKKESIYYIMKLIHEKKISRLRKIKSKIEDYFLKLKRQSL